MAIQYFLPWIHISENIQYRIRILEELQINSILNSCILVITWTMRSNNMNKFTDIF
jgi:hypothetical protein